MNFMYGFNDILNLSLSLSLSLFLAWLFFGGGDSNKHLNRIAVKFQTTPTRKPQEKSQNIEKSCCNLIFRENNQWLIVEKFTDYK